jgi:hypothetical protein
MKPASKTDKLSGVWDSGQNCVKAGLDMVDGGGNPKIVRLYTPLLRLSRWCCCWQHLSKRSPSREARYMSRGTLCYRCSHVNQSIDSDWFSVSHAVSSPPPAVNPHDRHEQISRVKLMSNTLAKLFTWYISRPFLFKIYGCDLVIYLLDIIGYLSGLCLSTPAAVSPLFFQ